jgi:succinate dehydrogenase / fumarate reductase membrane anchor subunit
MSSRIGLRDWKWQRLSAIILTLYTLYLGWVYIKQSPLTYEVWHGLFSSPFMRVWTFFALLCLVIHAWIGIWTVLTDYVKPLWIRYSVQTAILFVLLGYILWGFLILWGQ